MTTAIPANPENAYGLWRPKADGRRSGREIGQRLMTATFEQLETFPAKIEAGKVEALQMLDSRNACERAIGAFHHAFYIEIEAWMAKAARGAR